MYAIFRTWYLSLALLHPFKFFNFLKSSGRVFVRASRQFFVNFAWLIAIDAIFVLTIGDIIAKATSQVAAAKSLDPSLTMITLVQAVVWFLASSAFFLLIRKEDAIHPKVYFKIYFFRYMQILFTFSCLFLLFIYFLLVTGITTLPKAPWIFLMLTKVVELHIVFYWLDGKGYFSDMVYSCEKAINLLFYNAPIIAFFLLLLWISDYGICSLAGAMTDKDQAHLLFFNTSLYPTQETVSFGMLAKILAIKYGAFLIECFWLCIVFVFYRRKKHDQYAVSLFLKAQDL